MGEYETYEEDRDDRDEENKRMNVTWRSLVHQIVARNVRYSRRQMVATDGET